MQPVSMTPKNIFLPEHKFRFSHKRKKWSSALRDLAAGGDFLEESRAHRRNKQSWPYGAARTRLGEEKSGSNTIM